jgi:hypothetical protein
LTDANIVTALDISDSMMRHEEWIELDGLIRAVAHPALIAAIGAGRHGRVGFAAFSWASDGDFQVVVPWTALGSSRDAERIANMLGKMPRRGADNDSDAHARSPDRMTDISAAIRFGLELLAAAPFRTDRLVINVCGNGIDNVGEEPERARELAISLGVVINGVVVGSDPKLATYYQERVISGAGSFALQAQQPAALTNIMLKKLLLDLLAGAGESLRG